MNTAMKYFLLTYLCLTSVYSQATDYTDLSAYEIEVVMFKYTDSSSSGSEIWPDLVDSVSVENSIELHNSNSMTLVPGLDEMGYYYSKIPEEQFRLKEEVEKLNASGKYKILYHSAWIQPGLDKDKAESIHIKSSEADQQVSVIDTLTPVTINDLAVNTNQAVIGTSAGKSANNAILEGLIKVELGRYLHISFDLKYQRDLAPEQGIMNAVSSKTYKDIKYYPVQMQRRMRSKEVHYIDHPLIGILVLATPFEASNTEESPDVASPLIKLQDVPVSN